MRFYLIIFFNLIALTSHAKTVCIAHRGGGWNYFDNSNSAFQGAIEQKFEGIEIDLHQTKDGEIILVHDDNLSKVATGEKCPLRSSINSILYSDIEQSCRLRNGESVPTLNSMLKLFQNQKTQIILDLKDQLADHSIKKIIEAGVPSDRFRLTAFYPEFLRLLNSSDVLTREQIVTWNSIPRYENFRHPVFSHTPFNKNFHLFSAFVYSILNKHDAHFGAWEVNYAFFLRVILRLNPEFIVTKSPSDCIQIRDAQ